MTVADVVVSVVRYGLIVLFSPASALDKIFDFKGSVGQALEVFKAHWLAASLILVGIFIELVMPVGILTGYADRLAVFIMAGYCAVTGSCSSGFGNPAIFENTARARTANFSGTS